MDLWGRVASDHNELRELCRRVIETEWPDLRSRLFDEFVHELHQHLAAEEEVIYGALQQDDRTRADAVMVEREHDEIRTRLESLAAEPYRGSGSWVSRLDTLSHLLDRHFRLEEQGVLVTARGTLSADQAEELRLDYEDALAGLPQQQPAVTSIGQPLLILASGVLAGAAAGFLLDRARPSTQRSRLREPPNLNTGTAWSEADLFDLKNELEQGKLPAETAEFLCRTEQEVRLKLAELGLVAGDAS